MKTGDRIEFYKHHLEDIDIQELVSTLKGTFLTHGPKCKEFERRFAQYFGIPYALCFSSWTTGAFLVLKAWNIGPGDEVIVPAMTFIATSNIVIHCGARPIFVDVDPETGLMDINQVEKAITAKTKAIIPVHLYGQMVDMKKLSDLVKDRSIKILEDCAHSIEAYRDGIRPGDLSHAACFSFYATKNLACGDGGAVISADSDLILDLELLRQHGMSRSAASRYTERYQHWDMVSLGWKANLTDIQASLLLHQLDRLEKLSQVREEIAQFYERRFSESGIPFPKVLENSKSARHLFTIWAKQGDRDRLLNALQDRGIGVAVNYRPVHLMKYYRDTFGFEEGAFPISEEIGERTITIPLYPRLTPDQMVYIADAVCEAYDQ